jgi:hypothetical protein
MSNPERRVISRTVYVKPEKVGTVRRSRSVEAREDARHSVRVEQSPGRRAYVTPLPPVFSPRPRRTRSPQYVANPDPPRVRVDSTVPESPALASRAGGDECVGCFFTTLIIVILLFLGGVMHILQTLRVPPRQALLENISWTFSSRIHEWKEIAGEGWSLPPTARLLGKEERQHHTRTVTDGYETACLPVTKTREDFSHTETRCEEVMTRSAESYEQYSHSEKICYNDGKCENKDVYKTRTRPAKYTTVCSNVDRYVTVPYEEVQCRPRAITHLEPVFATYWMYSVFQWVPGELREVSSMTTDNVPEAPPGSKYDNPVWRYFRHFDNSTTVREVSLDEYTWSKDHIGEKMNV